MDNILNSTEESNLSIFINNILQKYEIYTLFLSGLGNFTNNFPSLIFQNSSKFILLNVLINQLILIVSLIENGNISNTVEYLSDILQYNFHTKVIIVTKFENPTDILELCWSKHLINAVVYETNTNVAFNYNPFPKFNVSKANIFDIFPNKFQNLFGYIASYALIFDPPRKFKYTYQDSRENGGYIWHVLDVFCESINLKLHEALDYDYVLEIGYNVTNVLRNMSIDFAPVRSGKRFPDESYYLEYIYSIPIVPVIMESDKLWYLLKPLNISTWIFWITSSFLIVLLKSLVSKILIKKFDFITNLRICVRFQIYQQSVPGQYLKNKLRLMFVPSLFIGFFVNAAYNGLLGSFLTKPMPGRQINSFEDLIYYNMKMMVIKEEVDTGSSDWKRKVKYHDQIYQIERFATVAEHRDVLNTTFGYIMPSDKWQWYLKLQQFKQIFIFREMEDDQYRRFFPVSMPLDRNSIYRKAFDKYIVDAYSAGLNIIWRTKAILEMSKGNLLFDIQNNFNSDPSPLAIDYFPLQFYFLLCGFILSFIVFCFELTWKRIVHEI